MKSPHEFFLETDGKIIDVDYQYGGQCWDLFALFCQEYCNKTFSCIETGYVIDLWNKFDEVGLGEFFEKVPNNELKDGDWAIWVGPCMITSHSHIAMFRMDNGNGGGTFLTQNPNGNPNYTHQMWISYQGLVGGLRPKCYMQDKTLPNPVNEDKDVPQLKINCNDTMNVRLGSNVNSESIGLAKEGFYNILTIERDQDNLYTWYEVEKNKWIALLPPYSEYIPVSNDNKDKENPLIEFIKWLIKLLEKLIGGTNEK